MSLALAHDTDRVVPLAAAAAATLLALTATGDTVLLAFLLGLVAMSALVGGVAAGVAAAVILRWGTSSLEAVSGAQAVLGPAVLVGSPLEIASAVLAALALVLICPPGLAAVPFGAAAALLAVGPAAENLNDALVRLAATVVAAGLATACGRWLHPRLSRPAGAAAAALAVLTAALG